MLPLLPWGTPTLELFVHWRLAQFSTDVTSHYLMVAIFIFEGVTE